MSYLRAAFKTFLLIPAMALLLTYSCDVSAAIKAMNFDRVTETVFRGGEPDTSDLKKLSHMGIKTVIDFRTPSQGSRQEALLARKLGMTHINIPWDPEFFMAWKYDYQKIFNQFYSIIEDKNNHPVYIHCQHGRDRTGSMLAAWKIKTMNISSKIAVKEMEKYGFNRWRYFNLVLFLNSVEKNRGE